MSLRILVAPSGFKEGPYASEVADSIERGLRRVMPAAEIVKLPLVDGGEGSAEALVSATGGEMREIAVTGPLGTPVLARFGFLGGDGPRTAVLDMASAAGLRLVPMESRDPLRTTTRGVGELVRAAVAAGAEKIVIGMGDSGTNDGGAGLAQALGVRLLDGDGEDIGPGGAELLRLARFDLSGRYPRLADVTVEVACNWQNVLCGPGGVASVFGPQKGASADEVRTLAAALEHYADVIERELGLDVREVPGGGASGGLGAGLHALFGATLRPRYDVFLRHLALDDLLSRVDLVVTAEGRIDDQTPRGKVPAEVAGRAKRFGLPVVALAGSIGPDAHLNYESGIDAFECILKEPCKLEEAIAQSRTLIEDGAERLLRSIRVGIEIGSRLGC